MGRMVEMKITLISHTPDPQGTVVRAIRECYQSMDKQDEVSDARLLKHIARNNESPLEFADFTFRVEGVSRACSHQLVRHRMASWAQKSQRYCSEESFAYVIPPSMPEGSGARSAFKQAMEEIQEAYDELISLGVRREDARFVLPNACMTSLICKFNARSLRHFLRLRLGKRAQWEIREVADAMLDQVHKVAPLLVEDILPG